MIHSQWNQCLYKLPYFTILMHSQREKRKGKNMKIPTIDFNQLNGDNRAKTLSVLHDACKDWGFFLVHSFSFLFTILIGIR